MIKIEVISEILHFKTPFKIAYEEATEAPVFYIKLEDEAGHCGLGSGSPDFEVTGELVRTDVELIQKTIKSDFFDKPIIENWYYYHEKIQKVLAGFPTAQSAVEEAVINLLSAELQIEPKNIFGGCRESYPIVMSVGLKNLADTLAEVERRLGEGYKIIKLKCGLNWEEDVEKIALVSKMLPADCELSLDANQGFTFEVAKNFLEAVSKFSNLKFIEQPLKTSDWEGLKKLHDLKLLPIIADESMVTFADAIKLLSGDYVDGLNVKLMKCGGVINFVKIFHLAKAYNKIIMIGCMYESNVSITTGTNLLLALPIDYADLDSGHLDFDDDLVSGGAIVKNGRISIGSKMKLKIPQTAGLELVNN